MVGYLWQVYSNPVTSGAGEYSDVALLVEVKLRPRVGDT